MEMQSVTGDAWSEYLADLRVYQVEYTYGDHSVMYSLLSLGPNAGLDVAEVHYCADGSRFYFIRANVQTFARQSFTEEE